MFCNIPYPAPGRANRVIGAAIGIGILVLVWHGPSEAGKHPGNAVPGFDLFAPERRRV